MGRAPTARRGLSEKEKLVLTALRRRGKPVSAYDLIDDLKPQGVKAPPTVYRALSRLIEAGLAHRLESLNAFVACQHDHHEAVVALAVCRACGTVEEFDPPEITAALAGWASRRDFEVEETTLELRGRCAACRGEGEPCAAG